ncbi:Uncharacterised protein [Mycobacterium tuberculosis]|nr:Uncharacterised protein [Mycobacterium tuberculosis]
MSPSSVSHSFTRSSRALAQRSSNTTAFLGSNTGATNRGQSAPSSAVTKSISSESGAAGKALTGSSSPSCPSTRRAAEASTPSRPVIWSVNSLSAAASMTLSTEAASASAPSCRWPMAPPRTLLPSRVPSATSTVTCLAQPSPSSQVFFTRSAMAPGRLPDGPRTVRSWSLMASESTGP